MSEEAAVSVSLEAPEVVSPPVTPDPPAQTAPPAVETPPPAADDDADEGVITAATGDRFVPLSALKSERQKRKDAESKVLPDADVQLLKQKAALYDESAQYLQQAKPIIEKIKNRPDIIALADKPPAQQQQQADQRAEAYAKQFDLYTPEGKPDITRAQAILADQDARMQSIAQQVVAPLAQTEAQRVAETLYQRTLQQPEVNGFKIDPKFLQEAWSVVPPELVAANPAVAELMKFVAAGRQVLSGHKPMQAPPPPVVPTEPSGGGRGSDQPLNQMSEKFQQVSGMKPADFRSTREKYTPGGPNSLE